MEENKYIYITSLLILCSIARCKEISIIKYNFIDKGQQGTSWI